MLCKTVKIDGKDVVFQSSAAITRLYRLKFKRDIFKDLFRLEEAYEKNSSDSNSEFGIEDLEIFENVAYCMALHANPTIPPTIEGWLDQFEMFSIYQILPEILELWGSNMYSEAVIKKNSAALNAI